IFPPLSLNWADMRELFEAGEAKGFITHNAPLVGHNSLRVAAMGAAGRQADYDEIKRMVRLLESALDARAFGLSSGLIYPPGLFDDPSELHSLVAVLCSDNVYTTHMRNESTRVFDSIAESLGRLNGRRRRHESQVKIADGREWHRMPELMTALDEVRDRGWKVSQDVYPYAAGSTMLTAALPPWFHDGGSNAVLA